MIRRPGLLGLLMGKRSTVLHAEQEAQVVGPHAVALLPTHAGFVGPQDRFSLGDVLGVFEGQGEQAAPGVTAAHRPTQLALQSGGVTVDALQSRQHTG